MQQCTKDAARLLLSQWLDALKTKDYDSFVVEVTPKVKAGLTSQMLEGIHLQVAPRMKKGYDAARCSSTARNRHRLSVKT